MDPDPLIEINAVVKHYQALRPLRMLALAVRAGERVCISGLDAAAAELFVNLVTGASLPEQGEIRTFGRSVAAIATDTEWLASLDRFGIVSHRAVLLEGSSIEQNLALPFTLEIDPIPAAVRAQIAGLAREAGLAGLDLSAAMGAATPEARTRVHVARALALQPSVLLLEHPTASLPGDAVDRLAPDLARICDARGLAALALSEDPRFARGFGGRRLVLHGATGELTPADRRGLFRWL